MRTEIEEVPPGVSRSLAAASETEIYSCGLSAVVLLIFALVLEEPELFIFGTALSRKGSDDKRFWWVAVSPLVSAECESVSASSQASAPERRTAAEAELEEKGLTRRVNPW